MKHINSKNVNENILITTNSPKLELLSNIQIKLKFDIDNTFFIFNYNF